MDINNTIFEKYDNKNEYLNNSRIIISDSIGEYNDSITLRTYNITDKLINLLFDINLFDDNYTIIKGNNPKITLFILTVGNKQFKYTFKYYI